MPLVSAEGAEVPGLERLEHLPMENPLSSEWVRVIHQDHQGFLWLGSINGIHRFDGLTVKSFAHDPGDPHSLPNNFINAIFADRRGVLWVATADGLARMDTSPAPTKTTTREFVTSNTAGRFRTYRHDSDSPGSLSHNYVHALVEGPQGELWVGTRVGVSRFDRELERFEHFEGEPSDLPGTLTYSAMLSRSSELWFGSSGPN
ncbi:MAG: two-component regulator propeller domain-containing protein [Acidobacteriota bacterium]